MLRKVKGGYVVKSHKTGKRLSRAYKSKGEAAKRLRHSASLSETSYVLARADPPKQAPNAASVPPASTVRRVTIIGSSSELAPARESVRALPYTKFDIDLRLMDASPFLRWCECNYLRLHERNLPPLRFAGCVCIGGSGLVSHVLSSS